MSGGQNLASATAPAAGFNSPVQREAPARSDNRDLLAQWRSIARRNFLTVGIFSLFINLLMLTLPIYLFQLSDRVLTSRSLDTLLMLSIVALGFIMVLSLLDVMRRQLLGRIATQMETLLAGPVLAGLVGHAQYGHSGGMQVLRNLHQVRSFIAGPVMLMLFDAPMAPIYFAAVFLIHPDLGFIAFPVQGGSFPGRGCPGWNGL